MYVTYCEKTKLEAEFHSDDLILPNKCSAQHLKCQIYDPAK